MNRGELAHRLRMEALGSSLPKYLRELLLTAADVLEDCGDCGECDVCAENVRRGLMSPDFFPEPTSSGTEGGL